MIDNLLSEIKKQASPKRAKASLWFFKTGIGQYGEGDVFVGLSVPQIRLLAKKYQGLPFKDINKLLRSKIHEHRFIALEILVMQYEQATAAQKQQIANFYLKNIAGINNWDLVDTSAAYILGDYLLTRPRNVLFRLAKSPNIWERRIAVVSSFAFIAKNQFDDNLKLATMLLADKHDLIHKAVGWMLREVGKRDLKTEIGFLDKHYRQMPRTMLRYAIEKFPDKLKHHYMAKG